MERPSLAWAIIWRMTLYGVGLGVLSGAICGQIIALIGFITEVPSGRYSDAGSAMETLFYGSQVFVLVGAVFGVIFGLLGGAISGISLALGLLLARGNQLAPAFYRNAIVGLCVTGPALIVLLSLGSEVLGTTWFFNGGNKALGFFCFAVLPAIACGISAWWATKRVISWWEKSGHTLRSLKPRNA